MTIRFAGTLLLVVILLAALGALAWVWIDPATGEPSDRMGVLGGAVNYGLLALAIVAGFGVFRQVSESARTREDALRPVLVLTRIRPVTYESRDEAPAVAVIQNVGSGPAMDVRIMIWRAEKGYPGVASPGSDEFLLREQRAALARPHDWNRPLPFTLGSGAKVNAPIWSLEQGNGVIESGNRVRYRLEYRDVFSRVFYEPQRGLGSRWADDPEGDPREWEYEIRFE